MLVYEADRQTVALSFCWNLHCNLDASTIHALSNLAGSFVAPFSRSVTHGLCCIYSSHVLYFVIKTAWTRRSYTHELNSVVSPWQQTVRNILNYLYFNESYVLQALMDRQKVDELPALQVQFFESTGIPVFKVWTKNSWFSYDHDFDYDLPNCIEKGASRSRYFHLEYWKVLLTHWV